MWELINKTSLQFECDDCTGDYQLSPPKFHLPPPPIPPSLKNLINCNEIDLQNFINNKDIKTCDAITTFTTSSTFTQTILLVGVFSIVIILVIFSSVICFRRLIKQKNVDCKDLKNLVKLTLQSKSKNLNKLPKTDSFYEEYYHNNEYTTREAKDFIGYNMKSNSGKMPTNNFENYLSIKSNVSGYSEPFEQHQNTNQYSVYNHYFDYFNEPTIQNHNYKYDYSRTNKSFTNYLTSTTPSTITTVYSSDCSDQSHYPEYVEVEIVVPNLLTQ